MRGRTRDPREYSRPRSMEYQTFLLLGELVVQIEYIESLHSRTSRCRSALIRNTPASADRVHPPLPEHVVPATPE